MVIDKVNRPKSYHDSLKEINDTGELKYKSKKVYSNIRKIEDVYRLEHPEITKKEYLGKKIVGYHEGHYNQERHLLQCLH